MTAVRDLELARASVRQETSVLEAAQVLVDAGVSAIAVVDGDDRVVGLLTVDQLVASLFPPYLRELRHTAFVDAATEALARRAGEAERECVRDHMVEPVSVELDHSTLHAAERFLHSDVGALAVVERGRFVGMLDQVAFARALLAQARGA